MERDIANERKFYFFIKNYCLVVFTFAGDMIKLKVAHKLHRT